MIFLQRNKQKTRKFLRQYVNFPYILNWLFFTVNRRNLSKKMRFRWFTVNDFMSRTIHGRDGARPVSTTTKPTKTKFPPLTPRPLCRPS